MDPRGGSAGNNWSLFVGGEQRDVTEFLDNDSLLLLQNLKDLRREIGEHEDQAAFVAHIQLRLQGFVDSLRDEIAVIRADAKRLRSRNTELEKELQEKRYNYVTTETSLKLASEDRMAMEKYLLELGEKCQHTHDQLEETKQDHDKLEKLYEQKILQMHTFYSKCEAAKQLMEIDGRLKFMDKFPNHEPLMSELATLDRHLLSSRAMAAEATNKAEVILARLSPGARQTFDGVLHSDNSDEHLEACLMQLRLLGGSGAAGAGAGAAAAPAAAAGA